MIVIEEDSFARLDTTLIANLGRTNLGNLCLNPRFFKDLLPNFGRFGILWDAIFFVTEETSDLDLARSDPDFFR